MSRLSICLALTLAGSGLAADSPADSSGGVRDAMRSVAEGERLERDGSADAARAAYERALDRLSGRSAPLPEGRAWNGLGRLHEGRTEWTSARDAYGRAADAFARAFPRPQEPEALARYQCAVAAWHVDDVATAERSLSRALEIWTSRGTPGDRGPDAARELSRRVQSAREASAR